MSEDASDRQEAAVPPTLARLLEGGATRVELERYLDALDPAARLAEVLGVTGSGVKRLYEAVDGPPVSLDEFIPAASQGTRIYEGRNSLLLFTRFQKRFTRVEGGVVVGYNHQSMAWVTGPGFFVLKPPTGEGDHGRELLIDYTEVPPVVPEGFPPYKPNDRGLSRPVYGHMHDYLRRVARGVYVGKAYRVGGAEGAVDRDAFFSLTLPPLATEAPTGA